MSSSRTLRRLAGLTAAGALTLGMLSGLPAAATPQGSTGKSDAAPRSGVDSSSAILRLAGEPLATSASADRARGKVDLNGSRTRSARAELAQQRKALKTWLRANAPAVKVTGEYDIALNAVAVRLNGTPLETLQAAPGVAYAGYQSFYAPAASDPDLTLIDAPAGWTAAGATSVETDPTTWAGYGTSVAIIDTGIDVKHPCFADTGFAPATQSGDKRFTNNKVVVARVYNNQTNRNGYTAEAIGDHGTHVAGTVACNLTTPAWVAGVDVPYDPSGVAPGARLGSYNVFPGDDGNARTEDIYNAMQDAVADGMDVINMSLGGGYHGVQDLGTVAVDNLDKAGVVVVVAGGNEGPGAFTVGSPGSAASALTVGASSVGHFVGVEVTSGGALVSGAAVGDFDLPASPLTAPLAVVKDGTALSKACAPLSVDLTGKIALVSRGSCTFGTKVAMAEKAGAVGVLVVNNVAGDPSAMGEDAAYPTTIPAVMVGLADKDAYVALDGKPVTLTVAPQYFGPTGHDNILAGFSSMGPTRVDYRVKPDVVAPGVNVLSALPLSYCPEDAAVATRGCWGLMSGTSMATPHVAGMAAVVRAANPAWAPWQVRSAIANTAKTGVVLDSATGTKPVADVQSVGNGLADLDAAVTAKVAFSSTTLSFGAVAGKAGAVESASVSVTNLTASTVTLPVRITDATAVFATSVSSVTLAPGASASVPVTYVQGPKKLGAAQAHLWVGDAHVALYAFQK